MNCGACGKEITYDGGKKFMALTTKEMTWGEHCIYPTTVGKLIVCSLKCLDEIISEEMRRTGEDL
jgi:hypothetical protein